MKPQIPSLDSVHSFIDAGAQTANGSASDARTGAAIAAIANDGAVNDGAANDDAANDDGGGDARLVRKYGGRAPRYTSYPTAVQFSDDAQGALYAQWLGDLRPDSGGLSLYLHVPFCERMCWYCGCHTAVVNKAGPIEDFVEKILQEIDLTADFLNAAHPVQAVHFGGGTPNILTSAQFTAIMAAVRRRFDIRPDAEIAVEMDPRLIDLEWVEAAARAGLNRASLGVQDFDLNVQQAINRVQPYEQVAKAVEHLRAAGVHSLNLDLMYGLPRQSLESLRRSIDLAASLKPDRLSLFGYAHVPWMKAHQKLIREDELADGTTRYRMQSEAARELERRGWRRLGLDHFASPADSLAQAAESGQMRRNFQGYTTDDSYALIGFGPSAISALPVGYIQNESAVPKWRARIVAGVLPAARGVRLTGEDRFRAEVIERLMCDLQVDLQAVCQAHGRPADHFANVYDRLDDMARDGLLVRDGARITATPVGRDFIRSIAAVFDAYLDPEAARHSLGV